MKNKLVLGTAQFGLDYGVNNKFGKISPGEVKKILDFAAESDIKLLDTAESYGDSHQIIGKYHKSELNAFEIITKYSPNNTKLPVNIIERILSNIETLKVDGLYCYMFHSYKDFKNFYPVFRKHIKEIKKKGLINKLGVSLYTNKEIQEILKYNEIDLIQIPFNLFENSNHKKEIILKAKKSNIEIHARSIFLQGLFFKNIKSLKGNLSLLKKDLEKIKKIKSEKLLTTEELALQYVLQKDFIDKALIGVDSLAHIIKNVSSCTKFKDLPNDEIEEIDISNKKLLNPLNW